MQQDSGRAFFSSLYGEGSSGNKTVGVLSLVHCTGEGSRCNKTLGVLSLVHCMGKAAVATRQWACCHWFTVRGRQPLQQDSGRAVIGSLYAS